MRTFHSAETKRAERIYRLLSWLVPMGVLLLWEIVVRVGWLDRRFFPAPTTVMLALWHLVRSGELFGHLFASLRRIFFGFLVGAIPGIAIGMLMGWFRGVRACLDPLIAALFPIPKISLLPLFMILFGLGETTKIVTVAMAGFFLIVVTTMHGVMRIDPVLMQAGQNCGATGGKLFLKVILPASLPAMFTGLRLALNVSLLVIVATEFVASNEGIGYFIWMSWSILAVADMYAGLVVIAILGVVFTNGLEHLGRALMPWANDITH